MGRLRNVVSDAFSRSDVPVGLRKTAPQVVWTFGKASHRKFPCTQLVPLPNHEPTVTLMESSAEAMRVSGSITGSVLRPRSSRPIDVHAPEVSIVGCRIARPSYEVCLALRADKTKLERACDAANDLVLQREHIRPLAVEALRPEVPGGRAVD